MKQKTVVITGASSGIGSLQELFLKWGVGLF